jgi:RNA polymerase sigma-70 factor (ECF subfamily)
LSKDVSQDLSRDVSQDLSRDVSQDLSRDLSRDLSQGLEPFRGELLVHCYQMLGSVHDAEDLVQETMMRAWRARTRYDPDRASVRTWLHRIATNACLTALEGRARRPLPAGLGAPSDQPEEALVRGHEVTWLQPLPDSLVGDPAAVVAQRSRLRLAFVAAVQLLPPRQRAVLILRDVLDFSAAEVASTLDTSTAAVNSALQRARSTMSSSVDLDRADDLSDEDSRAVVDRYMTAFEASDVPGLVSLLASDALLEMPPMLNWYVGREYYGRFIARVFATRGDGWRMVPLRANGQPAVAAYAPDRTLHTVQVFEVGAAGIRRNTTFQDPDVFALFGLAGSLGRQ